MKSIRSYKQKLSEVLRFWEDEQYDRALADVEELLKSWPGSARLHILWASLVQLQENPSHSLDEVKLALQHAVELDKDSPDAAIELGHFLDAVDDDPQTASKAFSKGVVVARRLLIEGLLGQAKALIQLNKTAEAMRCLVQSMYLAEVEDSANKNGSERPVPDGFMRDPTGRVLVFQLKGPFAERITELLRGCAEAAPPDKPRHVTSARANLREVR